MTCVAWDGRLLAVDSLSTCGDQILHDDANKLHRLTHPEHGIMIAGIAGATSIMAHWLQCIEKEGFGAEAGDMDDAQGLFVSRDGRCWTNHPNGTPIFNHSYATTGSGGLLANTVLRDGGDAIQAVRFAIRHSTTCGGPIRVYCPSSGVIARIK